MTKLEAVLAATVKDLLSAVEDKDVLVDGLKNRIKNLTDTKTMQAQYILEIEQVVSAAGYRTDQLPETIESILEWYEISSAARRKYEDKYYLLRGYIRCVVGVNHNEAFKKMLSSVKGMKELRKMKNKSGK